MAQHNWAYTGGSGRQYVVGLYHGTESGHLVVYCNLSVIYIDFSILQNWKYSFFIEDDLLELKIERRGDNFQYDFDVNRQIDTPKNRERKAEEKFERRTLWIGLAVFGALALFLLGAWWYNEVRVGADQLEAIRINGWQTPAKVFLETGAHKIRYSFVVDGKAYETTGKIPDNTLLPLESGDEFMVSYSRFKPHVNSIDFTAPSINQIKRYRQRALERQAQLHPDEDKDHIECLLDLAFEQKGVGGYADFYYQNTSPQSNPDHNQDTYGRLVRDIPFKNAVAERCK